MSATTNGILTRASMLITPIPSLATVPHRELSGWGLGEWQENPKCRKCRQTTTTISLQNKTKDRNAHECWPTNASIDRIIPASADGSHGPKDNRQLVSGCARAAYGTSSLTHAC